VAEAVKFTTGAVLTLIDIIVSSLHAEVVTVNFTLYVPLEIKVCEGLESVDTGLPSPKSQLREIMDEPFPRERSVKKTVSFWQIDVFALNDD
jgi:hypothetical protein